MGKMVKFKANGAKAQGYLATPASGSGAGVIVLQEWWGLVPQIKEVCNLLAKEGMTALAPDLYHGEIATHTEIDKAGSLMARLPPDRAAKDMSAAIDFLLAHDACISSTVGVTGFCMGGMLALQIAVIEGARVSAAVPFYGAPVSDASLDWRNLTAVVEGHFAAQDIFFPADACVALATRLQDIGKAVTFHFYPETSHGFGNWEDPLGHYDEQKWQLAWGRAVNFLKFNVV